jgi:3-methyl-2-oxobutanoate hydroxymethyltransferase
MTEQKVDVQTLASMKREGRKITMLTAYDYPTARILDAAGIDTLLVGDSAGNVVLGYPDTLPVTMDEMIVITRAVARAAGRALVIGDMPFMSFQRSIPDAIENAGRFVKQGGATAVKLEGGGGVVDTVRAIVSAGIPVVGHLGLLPQSASMLGGYRVQGLTADQAGQILDDARRLEDAGVFLIVVECIPDRLGALLSKRVSVPVIGIGAGSGCDGQVLVLHDVLGVKSGFKPRFVKRFAEIGEEMARAARAFRDEVTAGTFPGPDHVFHMKDEEYDKLV